MKKITYTLLVAAFLGGLSLSSCDRGEDYKQEDGGSISDSSGTAMYPEDKVQENTNLEDDDPLSMNGGSGSIEKRILMASLLRQKTDLENRIREMKTQSGMVAATAPSGDLRQLEDYVTQLDQEIANVRSTPSNRLAQVQESAMSAIEGAGALLQTTFIRVDSGF